MAKPTRNKQIFRTSQTLSDIEERLKEFVDHDVVYKIIEACKQYNTMSAAYLAHKFRLRVGVANKIMFVIKNPRIA